ncbi:MAG: hypothetical protein V4558_01335 [Gemmatimonadota bacterium]
MNALLIPIIALSIPLVVVVSKSSIGLAIADAIRHNSGADKGASTREQFEELSAEMEQLRGDVDQARAELLEVHERLDFAERLLAKGREDAHQGGS